MPRVVPTAMHSGASQCKAVTRAPVSTAKIGTSSSRDHTVTELSAPPEANAGRPLQTPAAIESRLHGARSRSRSADSLLPRPRQIDGYGTCGPEHHVPERAPRTRRAAGAVASPKCRSRAGNSREHPVLHRARPARPSRRSASVGRAPAGATERARLVGRRTHPRTPGSRAPDQRLRCSVSDRTNWPEWAVGADFAVLGIAVLSRGQRGRGQWGEECTGRLSWSGLSPVWHLRRRSQQ
jgi:hypothetical protein